MQSLIDQGLRLDGRKLLEHREIKIYRIELDTILIEIGGTILSIQILRPYNKPKSKTQLSFTVNGTNKNEDYAKSIESIFNRIIILPENTYLDININVKQEDGSTLVHLVNGISISLCCNGINMKSLVFGITVGLYGSNLIIDVLENEEKKGYLSYIFSDNNCIYLKTHFKISEYVFNQMIDTAEEYKSSVYELFTAYLRK